MLSKLTLRASNQAYSSLVKQSSTVRQKSVIGMADSLDGRMHGLISEYDKGKTMSEAAPDASCSEPAYAAHLSSADSVVGNCINEIAVP